MIHNRQFITLCGTLCHYLVYGNHGFSLLMILAEEHCSYCARRLLHLCSWASPAQIRTLYIRTVCCNMMKVNKLCITWNYNIMYITFSTVIENIVIMKYYWEVYYFWDTMRRRTTMFYRQLKRMACNTVTKQIFGTVDQNQEQP